MRRAMHARMMPRASPIDEGCKMRIISAIVNYRRFGRTNLALPVFSLGGMRYQESWNRDAKTGAASQKNLEATLDRALELGITHVETARGYGTSEAQLGPALARHRRDRFVLQTKVRPSPNVKEFEAQLEESFQLLKIDYLDLFAIHGVNDKDSVRLVAGAWRLPGGRRTLAQAGAHSPHRLLHPRAPAADSAHDRVGTIRLHQPALLLPVPGQPADHPGGAAPRHGHLHHQPVGQGWPPVPSVGPLARAVRAAVAHGVQRSVVPVPCRHSHPVAGRGAAVRFRRAPQSAAASRRSGADPGAHRESPGGGLPPGCWRRIRTALVSRGCANGTSCPARSTCGAFYGCATWCWPTISSISRKSATWP
jgi:hypothetical protein